MNRLRFGLTALSAGLVLALSPAGALAGDLDQQQPSADHGALTISSGQSVSQTFTAGKSGLLDQVDLDLRKAGAPPALTVEIRDVASGKPGSQVMASASVAAASVPTTLGFVSIPFPSPASVVAGTQYSIVAYTAGTSDLYEIGIASGTLYLGGAEFRSLASPPTTWLSDGFDTAFKSYVAPLVPPTGPSTHTGQRAAALKKCKKKRTSKARKKCHERATGLPV